MNPDLKKFLNTSEGQKPYFCPLDESICYDYEGCNPICSSDNSPL